jgi:sialate O-acetylesterase
MVSLDPMEAGGPYSLTISGEDTLSLSNVLIGEVWLASGQSNMEMGMRQGVPSEWNTGIDNWEEEIANADYPGIRLFRIPRKTAGKPLADVEASWEICSPSTVGDFSAVGFLFGEEIHQKLEVPVGLIQSAWGGTRIEPWTPPVGFEGMQSLGEITREIEDANSEYMAAVENRIDAIEAWVAETKVALQNETVLPVAPELPEHPLNNNSQPTAMYNAMIHGIVPYTIRGAIWYQGESNRKDGLLYLDKMQALINGWRTVWNIGEFPFYYVQIAPYRYADADPLHLARLREAQRLALNIPNTGMAVTMDIGDLRDIHPTNKQDVAHRLALWAFAQTYGYENVVYSGPLFRNTDRKGRTLVVNFDHTAGGLTTSDGNPPSWFEIAGEDGEFIPARTEIEGSSVRVWNQNLYQPVYVRYGWHMEAQPNLINTRGLPASPFNSMFEQ